jgi:endonuclease-3 related protein
MPTEDLRQALLAVNGIGPETADDILLYAFDRPVFVIDAYTRRVFQRLDLLDAGQPYEALRETFETALGPDAPLYNEYHALIVRHAKDICRPKPRCSECCLASLCPGGKLS